MNLLRFMEQFPDQGSCRSHLPEVRDKQGVICKKCTGKKHYWLKAKGQCGERLFDRLAVAITTPYWYING